jgi:hypothetical protein
VRWAAAILVPTAGHTHEVLPLVRRAIRDADKRVRSAAITSVARLRGNANGVLPELRELIKSDGLQNWPVIEWALWKINQRAAVQEAGWKRYELEPWRISAEFPGTPIEQKSTTPTFFGGETTVHRFSRMSGANLYDVVILEYPAELITATTVQERLDMTKNMHMVMKGELIEESDVALDGIPGRHTTVVVKDTGTLRSRFFLSESRAYIVQVTCVPQFDNPEAAEYFFNSVRITSK